MATAACDSEPPKTFDDARHDDSYRYDLVVGYNSANDIEVTINDQPLERLRRDYDTWLDARADGFTVRFIRDGQALLDVELSPDKCEQWNGSFEENATYQVESVCLYDCCLGYSYNAGGRCEAIRQEPLPGKPPCEYICEGCNPVTNLGCGPNERCVFRFPDGDHVVGDCWQMSPAPIAIDEVCVPGWQTESGVDDCVAGATCIDGVCRRNCEMIDGCESGTCVIPQNFPACATSLGVCLP